MYATPHSSWIFLLRGKWILIDFLPCIGLAITWKCIHAFWTLTIIWIKWNYEYVFCSVWNIFIVNREYWGEARSWTYSTVRDSSADINWCVKCGIVYSQYICMVLILEWNHLDVVQWHGIFLNVNDYQVVRNWASKRVLQGAGSPIKHCLVFKI
jgi:hypothetical protein